jgi:predicted ATPase
LDRLAPVKEIAQLGATLGREFSYELLHAVSPLDEDSLQQGLRQLVEVELLYQRGLPPQAQYFFKHALVQDAAYQSLLKSKRQQYHKQIVHVLEEHFVEIKELQPELLAHHYSEAGLSAQAIPYWQQAGQRAIQRSANIEAIRHFTKGLEVLKTLPDTSERTQQELALQIALGSPLQAIKGYGAPEVEAVYTRARELCQRIGETSQLFPVLRGLYVYYLLRGELRTAHELGQRLLSLAQSVQDPAFLLEAHFALGQTLLFRGEFIAARKHLEQGIALYDPERHCSHAFLYGQDPGVFCRVLAAWDLWLLGYPDQALKRSQEALAVAQETFHPLSLAAAQTFFALTHQFRREGQAAQEHAEVAVELSTEQGFPFFLAFGTILRGWALAEQGQGEEGTAQVRQGIAAYRATGAELAGTRFITLLAEAYEKVGQVEEGLRVLAEAWAMVDKNGEHHYKAELHRLRGKLALKQSRDQSLASSVQKEAEEYFQKAIEIAQRQQAKSLELRAVMSLVKLWQRQGKQTEAHEMLAALYNWFTEGFDTKDLQDAKALLDELS